MKIQYDWSTRHENLRHRLVLLAGFIFLLSRLRVPVIDATLIDTVNGTGVTKAEVVFILFVVFAYAFAEFVARTNAEARNVAAYSAKLQRTLHRIEEIRNKTALLFRSFEGALLSKRLNAWDDALKTASTLPSPIDMKLFEAVRPKIERLQASADRLRTGFPIIETHRSAEAGTSALSRPLNQEAREILDLLEKITETTRAFEERRLGLDLAVAESRDVMADAKSFFSDKTGRGAEDLNAKLAVAVANIKLIQQELRQGNRSYHLDRYVFSVHLPKLISGVLVLLSADVILTGARLLFDRVLAAISIILPL